jgi:hypothetical protein
MTHEVVVDVHVAPPGVAVAVYPEIGAPPSSDGEDHVTATDPFARVTPTDSGDPGTVAGVPSALASETPPDPKRFAAVTVTV